jgi:hypothetical protein
MDESDRQSLNIIVIVSVIQPCLGSAATDPDRWLRRCENMVAYLPGPQTGAANMRELGRRQTALVST